MPNDFFPCATTVNSWKPLHHGLTKKERGVPKLFQTHGHFVGDATLYCDFKEMKNKFKPHDGF